MKRIILAALAHGHALHVAGLHQLVGAGVEAEVGSGLRDARREGRQPPQGGSP